MIQNELNAVLNKDLSTKEYNEILVARTLVVYGWLSKGEKVITRWMGGDDIPKFNNYYAGDDIFLENQYKIAESFEESTSNELILLRTYADGLESNLQMMYDDIAEMKERIEDLED
jgi:hypothetical protein